MISSETFNSIHFFCVHFATFVALGADDQTTCMASEKLKCAIMLHYKLSLSRFKSYSTPLLHVTLLAMLTYCLHHTN